jgi:hypothetical protein
MSDPAVIPAYAGIQCRVVGRQGRWVPAPAGTTTELVMVQGAEE